MNSLLTLYFDKSKDDRVEKITDETGPEEHRPTKKLKVDFRSVPNNHTCPERQFLKPRAVCEKCP